MKATQLDNVIILTGFGSGEAEFPNGAKIKKGLITFPNIPVRVNP